METFGVKTSLGFEMLGISIMACFLASTERMAWKSRMWTLVILVLLPLWAVLNNIYIALSFRLSIL